MKKGIKLKVFDLRCDKYLQDAVLVLVLRDEDSGGEILLPISDYEFRYIKNLVFKKNSSSYIDSLSKSFFFKKNELIIQDEEIKSKLTFSTTDNFTQEIVLPPIEALLYCADRKIEIFVEEETFQEIQKLDFRARQNISEEVTAEAVELVQSKNDEKTFFLKEPSAMVADMKENFIDFQKNANILNFNDNDSREEIVDIRITEENVKNISDENLLRILKICLAEYHYENAMLIQEELENRKIDFRHELCKEDFL